MGCCDQYLLREKNVSVSFAGGQRGVGFGRRPFFLSVIPIELEPRTLIRCFEIEGIDRR